LYFHIRGFSFFIAGFFLVFLTIADERFERLLCDGGRKLSMDLIFASVGAGTW
jgi:hypothetical protein